MKVDLWIVVMMDFVKVGFYPFRKSLEEHIVKFITISVNSFKQTIPGWTQAASDRLAMFIINSDFYTSIAVGLFFDTVSIRLW